MVAESSFFRDFFAYVFVAALAGGLLAWRSGNRLSLVMILAASWSGRFTPGTNDLRSPFS